MYACIGYVGVRLEYGWEDETFVFILAMLKSCIDISVCGMEDPITFRSDQIKIFHLLSSVAYLSPHSSLVYLPHSSNILVALS